MTLTFPVVIHIAGGSVGLTSGAFALITQKGSQAHRLWGNIFFASMIVMALSGGYLAFVAKVHITVLAAVLSLYLILSSLLTVKTCKNTQSYLVLLSFFTGICVVCFGAYLSWRASIGITDRIDQYSVPAAIYYIFTSIAILGVATDLRVIIGKGISGKQRIIRHLWRMCVPLYIATSSFFTGQRDVFPENMQDSVFLSFPEYIVLLALCFWLGRVWWFWPVLKVN